MRVFHDGGDFAPYWFELEPDRFWCGFNLKDAMEHYTMTPNAGLSLERLRDEFGSKLKQGA